MNGLRPDHLVLAVASIPAPAAFYEHALGFHTLTFGEERTSLAFVDEKINLQAALDLVGRAGIVIDMRDPDGNLIEPSAHEDGA